MVSWIHKYKSRRREIVLCANRTAKHINQDTMATPVEQTSSASDMDLEKGRQEDEKEDAEHPHRASQESSRASAFSESHSKQLTARVYNKSHY